MTLPDEIKAKYPWCECGHSAWDHGACHCRKPKDCIAHMGACKECDCQVLVKREAS